MTGNISMNITQIEDTTHIETKVSVKHVDLDDKSCVFGALSRGLRVTDSALHMSLMGVCLISGRTISDISRIVPADKLTEVAGKCAAIVYKEIGVPVLSENASAREKIALGMIRSVLGTIWA